MRPCPFCAQTIDDHAPVCPFCRANLAGAPAVYSEPETSGKAIGSLVCGILFFFPPSAVLAVIMGHLSLSEIRRSAGRLSGKGMAIAGLVLGYAGLAWVPILIIAAIAIPNLLRAKMAANETSAIATLREYNDTLEEYAAQCPNRGYPPDPTYIGENSAVTCPQALSGQRNVPKAGALPMKSGYRFFYIPMQYDGEGHISKYGLSGDPITPGTTGAKHFYTDETGVIRFTLRGGADSKSPPVQ